MDRKRLLAIIGILALTISLLCAMPAAAEEEPAADEAVSDGQTEQETDADEAEEEDFEGLVRLGEQTEGCGMVKITNLAGTDIMMINIRRSGEEEWSENLLAEDDTLDVDESAVLCFELTAPEEGEEAEDAEETEEDGEAEAEPVAYDLQVIFVGVTGGTCHNIVLEDVKDAQIMRAWNSIPYLVYTSVSTGEQVDMSEAEQAIVMEEYYASQSASSSSGSSSSGGNANGCIGNGSEWLVP